MRRAAEMTEQPGPTGREQGGTAVPGPRRALGALAALVLLLGVLVGVPAVLVVAGSGFLPDSVPTADDVGRALTTPDDGSVLLGTAVVVAWLAWAVVAATTVAEVVAVAAGVRVPRLPGPLQWQQQAVRGLVVTVAALFVGTSSAVAATPLPDPAGGTPAPVVGQDTAGTGEAVGDEEAEGPAAAAAGEDAAGTAGAAAPREVTVAPGDTLWSIAERELGDGTRHVEIARLNADRVQSDGSTLGSSRWLRAGWTLQIPQPAETEAAVTDEGTSLHRVERGDTLWDLAADRLGDGTRYPEIVEASRDIVQPGGARLVDPDVIDVGWTVAIPTAAPASDLVPSQQPASPEPDEPDAPAPPDAEADPAPAPGEATSGADGATEPEGGGVGEAEGDRVAEPEQDRVGEPGGDRVGEPGGSGAAETGDRGPSADVAAGALGGLGEDAAAADAGDDEPAEDDFPLRTAAGLGSLASAGVLALVATRRRQQQRHRPHGAAIALPTGSAAALEGDLRSHADPDSVARVDAALRQLAAHVAAEGQAAAPALRAARLGADGLDVFLDGVLADGPPGWLPDEGGAVWTVPTDVLVQTRPPGPDADDVPSPYPALVTLGQDDDDGHVLVNLEHLGMLGVVGDPVRSRATVAAMVLELANSVWADDLTLTLVGDWPQVEEVLMTGRVRYVPSASRVVDELEERAATDRTALAALGLPDVATARVRGRAPDAWTPDVLVLAGDVTAADRARLHDVVTAEPGVAVGVVSLGESTGDWTLVVPDGTDLDDGDADVRGVLEPVGLALRLQHLPDEAVESLLYVVQTADTPAESTGWSEPTLADIEHRASEAAPAAGGRPARSGDGTGEEPMPQHPTDSLSAVLGAGPGTGLPVERSRHRTGEDAAPDVESAPAVLVLGPVEVVGGTGPVEPTKRHRLTELAAYLALNPGQGYATMDEALWPGRRVSVNARNTMVSKLRRWLGQDPAGRPHLPPYSSDGGYALSATVRCDWWQWQELLPGGPEAASTADLTAALRLVRGRPFDGTRTRAYTWAEYPRQYMISAVVDAAAELSRRHLDAGDWAAADESATQGLMLEPGMERLWRLRILAARGRRDATAVRRTVDRMLAIIDDLGGDLEPETEQLLAELDGGPVAAARAVYLP